MIQLQPEPGEIRRCGQESPRGRLFQALKMLVQEGKNTENNWGRKIEDDAPERQEYEEGVKETEIPPCPPPQENRGGKHIKIKDKYVHSKKKFLGPNTMISPSTWPGVAQSPSNLSLNSQGLTFSWPFVPNPCVYAWCVYFIHVSLNPNLPIKHCHQFS